MNEHNDAPTIKRQEGWPEWAEWYAVDYSGRTGVYEFEPVIGDDDSLSGPSWFLPPCGGRWQEIGDALGRKVPFWFRSKRRIVRTPKEAPGPERHSYSATKAASVLAKRLTLLGQAAYARKVLIEANIPVPARVEREATGRDLVKGSVEPEA